MPTVLITGSSGLVGSACVRHFNKAGWEVVGLDGNQRAEFFGQDGDTLPMRERLVRECDNFIPHAVDIRKPQAVNDRFMFSGPAPELVIHCAAQPSHDWATDNPMTDFHVNAVGTLNLLEATRQHAPAATFIFCSTNKVYGDTPNRLRWTEWPTRWGDSSFNGFTGFNELTGIDQSRHSLFGASKLAADILVQEYGRTFGMKTACFRMGCITGGAHAGAEQHGFLAYLVRCAREGRKYTIYGYKGKQVRDNLHADDVAKAFALFAANPKVAAVYNLGGGRENSVSVLEAIATVDRLTRKRMTWDYCDQPRGGDHIVWYSDCTKLKADYPQWRVTRDLDSIFEELCHEESNRHVSAAI